VHNTLEVKLAPGDYTLEVSAENYEPAVFETKIVSGKETSWGR
jgi:hypothetical protein